MQELSTYSVKSLLSNDEVAGEISEGFKMTALPAAIAPITGSIDNAAAKIHNYDYTCNF